MKKNDGVVNIEVHVTPDNQSSGSNASVSVSLHSGNSDDSCHRLRSINQDEHAGHESINFDDENDELI